MLAIPGDLPRSGDWSYEIKWDGIRVLAVIGAQGVQLLTRNGSDVTARYPELTDLHRSVAASNLPLVLDGEIVALDEHAKPNFHLLQSRMNLSDAARIDAAVATAPIHLALFDILVHAGKPVIDLPQSERRALLNRLELNSESASVPRAYDEGKRLLEQMVERGWEGVVAKRKDSTYRPGVRSADWIKVKCKPRQEFVVGGWTAGTGHRAGFFGSLLIGYHERPGTRRLKYAGNVGSGFDDRDLSTLLARLVAIEREASPFDGPVDVGGTRYVKPELVVEVEFQEFTPDGRLRQPVFKGLRPDKRATEVVLERPKP